MSSTTWKDPPLQPSRIGPIRLVAAGDSVAIYCGEAGPATGGTTQYSYQTSLIPIAVTGPQPSNIVIPQRLAGVRSFDLAVTEGSTLAFVIEDFGGATNALVTGAV